ncbi:HupE/UreJ family protein [Luteitalea pratensis]|uniref:HupE/UreJ family protein n=1 Tax=Luteitalea pratensis TaxID=1855912 RepID=UPI0012FF63BC|nr:HupE/UreJ family protein [Luteitalea pratensis]
MLTLVGVLFALLVWAGRPAAHDLPADVVVHAFVKPEGQRLRVLVRVPLEAMRDVDYPTRGPEGLLDLTRIDRALADATSLWLVPAFEIREADTTLARPRIASARISLPSDRSFVSYEQALAHVTGPPLDAGARIYWNQSLLDVLLEYDIRSDRSALTINPVLARLGVRVATAVRFLPPGGGVRAFEWVGNPGLVRLDPRWHQAAWRFVQLGFSHILGGADHLLFLVCLAIPIRRLRALVPAVTAFAVAHSITLIASAFDLAPSALWFPPLIETLIALSIVCMAIENMMASTFAHRWVLAFGFGLVHGFGFGFALRESLQFAGAHLVASLLAFNVGVELGQVLVLLLILPPLALAFRHAASERVGTIVLSAVVAHVAWHWMVDRGAQLARFSIEWPQLDAAFAAATAGWLVILVVAAGALRLLRAFRDAML